MNWETLLKSVEFWNYLPISTLVRLLQCNRAFYQMLSDKKIWRVLISRDFGLLSNDPCEYKKISNIVRAFRVWPEAVHGKSLTTDALKMLLYFYPSDFHKSLRNTSAFLDHNIINTNVLVEATLEVVQEYCPDYNDLWEQDYVQQNKIRAFLNGLGSIDGTFVHVLH